MFKLIVKFRGKTQNQIEVPADLESLVIGRKKSCFLVLDNTTNISREHILLSFSIDEESQEKIWRIKNLSSSSPVFLNGEELIEESLLSGGALFQVQDYTFQWVEEKKPPSSPPAILNTTQKEEQDKKELVLEEDSSSSLDDEKSVSKNTKENQEEALAPAFQSHPKKELSLNPLVPKQLNPQEQTMMMEQHDLDQQLQAYLKIYSKNEDPPKTIALEQDKSQWVVGRDIDCDILIDEANMSRKHFKLYKDQNNYFISDQKSANKTILNDKELEPKQKYSLHSGDLIFVLDTEIQFEIKNLALERELQKLNSLPVPRLENPLALSPTNNLSLKNSSPTNESHHIPPSFPNVIVEEEAPPFWKKNPKKLLLYSGVGVFIFLLFALQENPNKKISSINSEEETIASNDPLSGLNPGQAQMVKDAYLLAKQLYSQGKFIYCKSETNKIHALIESYEDSRNLENACLQASENQQSQFELNLRKKKAKETDDFIQKVSLECKEKFSSFKTKPELIACLNPAIELSPADTRIQSLIETFDFNEAKKQEQAQRKRKRKKFIASIVKKYDKAKKLEVEGKPLKAISAYENFIKISQHKELNSLRAQALHELAEIKQNYNEKVSELNTKCQAQWKLKNFKEAWSICNKGAKIIVSPRNEKLLLFKNKSQGALEKLMKPKYEEASLNESTGNIEIAIKLWKEILALDVESGKYYKMAKKQMKKF